MKIKLMFHNSIFHTTGFTLLGKKFLASCSRHVTYCNGKPQLAMLQSQEATCNGLKISAMIANIRTEN